MTWRLAYAELVLAQPEFYSAEAWYRALALVLAERSPA